MQVNTEENQTVTLKKWGFEIDGGKRRDRRNQMGINYLWL